MAQIDYQLDGQVVAPDGKAIPGATVQVAGQKITTDSQGRFQLKAPSGSYQLEISASNYSPLSIPVSLNENRTLRIQLETSVAITIRAEPDVFSPDPLTRILVRENVLDANPGRPGVPISVPGYPVETASGGVKAPQYFAPGVAGDHGEPTYEFVASVKHQIDRQPPTRQKAIVKELLFLPESSVHRSLSSSFFVAGATEQRLTARAQPSIRRL